jgi:hypothetical protein
VLDQRGAVIDHGRHHSGPADPDIAGHRRHRMPITAHPPTRLLTRTLTPRRPRPDLRMSFGPGPLLALHMGAAPDTFDPHQRHRPIPGRQIPHPRRTPIMQPGHRPAHRAPTRRRRGLDRVLQLAVALRYGQHGHAFQPEHHRRTTVVHHLGPFIRVRNTTNHEAPGPFPNSASQPCRPAATTIHCEEPN